jgi:hypothetical protein
MPLKLRDGCWGGSGLWTSSQVRGVTSRDSSYAKTPKGHGSLVSKATAIHGGSLSEAVTMCVSGKAGIAAMEGQRDA